MPAVESGAGRGLNSARERMLNLESELGWVPVRVEVFVFEINCSVLCSHIVRVPA